MRLKTGPKHHPNHTNVILTLKKYPRYVKRGMRNLLELGVVRAPRRS